NTTPGAGNHPLSLHDALPIWRRAEAEPDLRQQPRRLRGGCGFEQVRGREAVRRLRGQEPQLARETLSSPTIVTRGRRIRSRHGRSEEHTSELQSREKLVCRLL